MSHQFVEPPFLFDEFIDSAGRRVAAIAATLRSHRATRRQKARRALMTPFAVDGRRRQNYAREASFVDGCRQPEMRFYHGIDKEAL